MFVDIIKVFKCLFYSDLPQTTINIAVNDLRKRLSACVLVIMSILCELGSRALNMA